MSSRTTTKKSLCSIEPTCIRENEGFFRSFLLQHVTFFSVFPPSPLSLFRDPCFFFLRLPVEHILFCSFPFSSRLFLSPLSENFHLSVFCCCFFTSLLTVFFSPSHSPSRVCYFRFLYLNPAVSCTFSLWFVFSFFLFSLSTPNKASRSPNDCFKHLDSTVGYLGNAKF